LETEQEEVDDLIHDEGEELPDERDLARVYRRVEADQRARDADMSPEELEEYVKRRFERPGFDAADMGEEQAGARSSPPFNMTDALPPYPLPLLPTPPGQKATPQKKNQKRTKEIARNAYFSHKTVGIGEKGICTALLYKCAQKLEWDAET
jgi:hypothetical protein